MTIRALVLAVCFAVAAVLIGRAQVVEPRPIKQPLAELPFTIGDWQGRDERPFTKDILAILGVDEYVIRSYFRPSQTVGLYVGYYQSQRQGDTIHSPLNCPPGAGWIPVRQERPRIVVQTAKGPRSIEVNAVVIEKALDRQLVLYWYQSHSRVVASEYWGKFYTVADAIRDNRTDAALVRVIVPVSDRTREAEVHANATGTGFVQALFSELERHLPS